jgi:hypothetical protein
MSKKAETMGYTSALYAIATGSAVSRLSWAKEGRYLHLNRDSMVITMGDDQGDQLDLSWTPESKDMEATDWFIVKDQI